jgi:single-strand DNA-binding protein
MINDAVLIGRLTKAVDVRYTQGGAAVGNFTLAVNRNFKNAAGEREADFISCVIWKKSAENLANFTHKGSLVSVRGRINTRHYDKDGSRVYVTEVVVDEFSLLEPRDASPETPQAPPPADAPQPAPAQESSDPLAAGQTIDISDDDLPF